MPAVPMKRLFLVGCPRSGTTLLQSLVAAHPQVISFPESHFFTRVISARPILRRFGLASLRARAQFIRLLGLLGRPELRTCLPRFAVTPRQYAHAFTTVLDTVAREQHKQAWLEKTPRHLDYIDDISALVPNAKFIHVIRNGADVVASLYETVNDHPDSWRHRYANDLDHLIERWLHSIALTQQYVCSTDHFIVRYEHLVDAPERVLTQLCQFSGLPFASQMLDGFRATTAALVLPHETWKQSASTAIEKVNQKKFYRLFDAAQRLYISQKIAHIQLDELTPLI
jgi:Sulfotransferase family